jgi:hypothetical protein
MTGLFLLLCLFLGAAIGIFTKNKEGSFGAGFGIGLLFSLPGILGYWCARLTTATAPNKAASIWCGFIFGVFLSFCFVLILH